MEGLETKKYAFPKSPWAGLAQEPYHGQLHTQKRRGRKPAGEHLGARIALTLEAEQASHMAQTPKRPCNFQLTSGGKINL